VSGHGLMALVCACFCLIGGCAQMEESGGDQGRLDVTTGSAGEMPTPPEGPPPASKTRPPPPADRGRGSDAHRLETGATGLVEVFPGVRVDRQRGVVEVDGRVATNVHDPETPEVWLEVLVCTPDTREHEALVVIDAKAEHVQAGLLLAGFEAGEPGRWEERRGRLEATPPGSQGGGIVGVEPTGDRVEVLFVVGGKEIEPASWVVLADGKAVGRFEWVFAGSKFREFRGREVYLAGVEGTVVGLTTFGTEIVGLRAMHHPDSAIEQPRFLANVDVVPAYGVRVVVRLKKVGP
jgi:hypothetical protein